MLPCPTDHRNRRHLTWFLILFASAPIAWAQDPAASSPYDQIIDAYRNTQTYHATIHFQQNEKQGRWDISRRTTFELAFDRDAERLLVDKPGVRVVIDGGILRARSPQFRGRHLEVPVTEPLQYPELVKILPALAQPMLPDLVLLLGEDPSKASPNFKTQPVEPDPNDPEKRPGCLITTPQYTLISRFQSPSYLPLFTAVRWNPRVFQRPDSDILQALHQIELHVHNESLDEATFALDTAGSKAVRTVAELAGRHRLEQKTAPPMALAAVDRSMFRLTEATHRTVLIGFWATWYPGWNTEVEVFERLHAWADKEKMPLTVVTVNVNDSADTVREKAEALAVPILLGAGKEVVKSYDAEQLPRAVLVDRGRIVKVFDGMGQAENNLKQMVKHRAATPDPGDGPN